jgi:hypothetical protein
MTGHCFGLKIGAPSVLSLWFVIFALNKLKMEDAADTRAQ